MLSAVDSLALDSLTLIFLYVDCYGDSLTLIDPSANFHAFTDEMGNEGSAERVMQLTTVVCKLCRIDKILMSHVFFRFQPSRSALSAESDMAGCAKLAFRLYL